MYYFYESEKKRNGSFQMQKKVKRNKKKFGIEKLPYYTIQILLDSLFSRAKCSGSFSKKNVHIHFNFIFL